MMFFKGLIIGFVFALFSGATFGASLPGSGPRAPLPVEDAFVLQSVVQDDVLFLRWVIAEDHYLYKGKLHVRVNGVDVPVKLPPSEMIDDPYFGHTDIYQYQLEVSIPRIVLSPALSVDVVSMGCAKAGLCYPEQVVEVKLPDSWSVDLMIEPVTSVENAVPSNIKEDKSNVVPETAIKFQGGATMLFGVFLLGLGLALTPCVFPMYPILTGIIAGQQGKLSLSRTTQLSFAYVQGMALTYALVGLLIASVGAQIQGYLQHPALLVFAAGIFVVLSLSMFGVLNLAMPSRWQEKVDSISRKQQGGSILGVFIMGALSGLIASPCTTAPLSAILLYVAQSGELAKGFITLYVLSLGMGVPLFILGSSGGKWLPKPGPWMAHVKNGFGFALLLVPIVLLERILPFSATIIIATCWVIALLLYVLNALFSATITPAGKAFGVLGVQAVMAMLVVFHMNHWLLDKSSDPVGAVAAFETVNSVEQLKAKISASPDQPVLLDLYADWCVACKEFEFKTFPDPAVQEELKKRTLLKVDMTTMSPADKAFMKKHGVMGLPTLMLFTPSGKECEQHRVSGYMPPSVFAKHLSSATQAQC